MPLLKKWRPLLHVFEVFVKKIYSLLVEAVPEKTKVATKYGVKIFHGKTGVEK